MIYGGMDRQKDDRQRNGQKEIFTIGSTIKGETDKRLSLD